MQKLPIAIERAGKPFLARGIALHFIAPLKGIEIRNTDILAGEIVAMRGVFPALVFHDQRMHRRDLCFLGMLRLRLLAGASGEKDGGGKQRKA